MGFSGVLQVKIRLPMQETQEMRVQSPGWKDGMEKGMATNSSAPA